MGKVNRGLIVTDSFVFNGRVKDPPSGGIFTKGLYLNMNIQLGTASVSVVELWSKKILSCMELWSNFQW